MDPKEALTRVQNVCSRQEQCTLDIYGKLEKWGLGEPVISQIIGKLEKEGFIDEFRYAASYARDKFKFNKWGRIKIAWMLRQKNIPEDLIKRALDEIDNNEYENLLIRELDKKMRNMKSLDPWSLKGKLIQFASQRGFESEMVYQVIKNLLKARFKK